MKRNLLLVIAACGSPPVGEPRPARPLADRVLACHDRLARGDWDEHDCLAPRVIARVMDGETADGAAAAHAMYASLHDAVPDLRVTPQLVLVDGRTAFVQSLVTTTDPASHRTVGIYVVEQLTFDDADRIAEDDVYLGASPESVPAVTAPNVVVAAGAAAEAANVTIVRDWIAAINAHDLPRVLSFLAADPIDSDAGIPAELHGKEVEGLYANVLHDIPDYHREIAKLYAAGDYVVEPGIKTGTWGKSPVRLHYVEVIEVRGGKLATVRRFYNTAAMGEQIERGAH